MKKIVLGLLLCMPMSASAVMINLLPSTTDLYVGDSFQIDIVADIASSEPLLGWGLDLDNSSGLLTQLGVPTIGPAWLPAPTLDGDGLAGLAFPMPVTGSGVLLASLTFQAMAAGVAGLTPLVTQGDLTEGFPLAPPTPGFADMTLLGLSLTIQSRPVPISAPNTALLMSLMLVPLGLGAGTRGGFIALARGLAERSLSPPAWLMWLRCSNAAP